VGIHSGKNGEGDAAIEQRFAHLKSLMACGIKLTADVANVSWHQLGVAFNYQLEWLGNCA